MGGRQLDEFGDRLHVAPRIAQQHDVEVALRAELGSAVPSDRDQRRVLHVGARNLREQGAEPLVDQLAVSPAPMRAAETAVGEQRSAFELHRRNGSD